jgi:protein O-GlcNAc transferase
MTILRPLLPELARRFELYGYYDDNRIDEYTDEARRSFAVWRNTSELGEADAAKLIHEDALDVLIDISGHFNGARTRILTYRPAPVQIHYADSSSSLGIKAVPYRFSDAVAEPPERGDPYSTEAVLRLPHGFFLYQPLTEVAAPAPCPAEVNGYVTFGSCTALYKITPTTLRLWRSALEAVPGSVFLLARDEFERDEALRDGWMRRFEEAGIPRGRFTIETGSKEDFVNLRFYDRIDIALDAYPYSGVTTTLDALWMGVPMVNYRQTRLINRVCSSLLERVGLGDLVADRFDDFAVIAAKLAADCDRRRRLRRNLRDTMRLSPLCDPAGMAGDMENAIRGVLGAL